MFTIFLFFNFWNFFFLKLFRQDFIEITVRNCYSTIMTRKLHTHIEVRIPPSIWYVNCVLIKQIMNMRSKKNAMGFFCFLTWDAYLVSELTPNWRLAACLLVLGGSRSEGARYLFLPDALTREMPPKRDPGKKKNIS